MSKLIKINPGPAEKNNQDVYQLLESMADNLEKLFDSLGIEDNKYSVKTPRTLIKILQTLMANGVLAGNIAVINEKIKLAVKKNEEIRIDAWSNIQNAETYESRINELTKAIMEKEYLISSLQAQIQNLRCEKNDEEKEFNELSIYYKDKLKQRDKAYINLINSFITFRDTVILREELASGGEAIDSCKLLTSLLMETAGVFEKNNIHVLDQKGKFDSSIQVVTDVADTGEEDLHDMVSEVFRPGYIMGDVMIRPEEVILYRYKTE